MARHSSPVKGDAWGRADIFLRGIATNKLLFQLTSPTHAHAENVKISEKENTEK